jgi:hypothetical protein
MGSWVLLQIPFSFCRWRNRDCCSNIPRTFTTYPITPSLYCVQFTYRPCTSAVYEAPDDSTALINVTEARLAHAWSIYVGQRGILVPDTVNTQEALYVSSGPGRWVAIHSRHFMIKSGVWTVWKWTVEHELNIDCRYVLVIPFHLQSVPVHSANCVKTCAVACRNVLGSAPL